MRQWPDPTELTPEQEKAVSQLKRAFTSARKAGVYFYTVLGDIHALNGNLVEVIYSDDDSHRADCSIRQFGQPKPVAKINGEFADDEHYVKFRKRSRTPK